MKEYVFLDEEKIRFEVKRFPLEQAIIEAAWQNFVHDVNNEVEDYDDWEEVKEAYIEEAEYILRETGQNYIPEPGEYIIAVKP